MEGDFLRYCSLCGKKLTAKPAHSGRLVPYCENCKRFFFPPFSCAVITALLSPDLNQTLLLRQYGSPHPALLSGYVDKGESAEEALLREVQEESGLVVKEYRYFGSSYFSPSNTLMLSYLSVADSTKISPAPGEVDFAGWFPLAQARELVWRHTLAESVLLPMLDSLESYRRSLSARQ